MAAGVLFGIDVWLDRQYFFGQMVHYGCAFEKEVIGSVAFC